MDPVSLVSVLEATGAAIGACSTIIRAIKRVVNDVKKVDESTTKIKLEITSLSNILGAVKTAFERFQAHNHGTSLNILAAVSGSITDCNNSLRKLVNIFRHVRSGDEPGGVIASTQQAFRLRDRYHELDGCRSEIEQHKLSLNLSLTIVIFAICSEPSPAPYALPEDDSLSKLIDKLQRALDRVSSLPIAQAEESENRMMLKNAAKQILQKSTDAASKEGSTFSAKSSSSGKEEYVESWIQRLEEIEQDEVTADHDALFETETSETFMLEVNDALKNMPSSSARGVSIRRESPTKFFSIKFKLAKNMIDAGCRQYELDDFTQASRNFTRALEHASKADPQSQAALDLDQVYFKLGSICLRERDFDGAEVYFRELTVRNPSSESELVPEAYVKLGELCLSRNDPRRNDLDNAVKYCEEATNKIVDRFGDTHERYYEAFLLMSMVYDRQGLQEDAMACLNEVPEHLHSKARLQPFNTSPKPPLYSMSDTVPYLKSQRSGSYSLRDSTSSEHKTFRKDSSSTATETDITESFLNRKVSEMLTLEPSRSSTEPEPQAILEAGNFVGNFDANKALLWAIKRGSDETVKLLLKGHRIRARKKFYAQEEWFVKKADPSGSPKLLQSPLHLAITENLVNIASSLISAGASLTTQDPSTSQTPLSLAAALGNAEMVRLFPATQIKHECSFPRTRTPLHIAVEKAHFDATELLLEAGANPDIGDVVGMTALKRASLRSGHQAARLVCRLLEFGASAALADDDGNTPLMSAVQAGNYQSVSSLVTAVSTSASWSRPERGTKRGGRDGAGGAINVVNRRGQTALMFCALHDRAAEARVLLEAGADPDVADLNGWTPLIAACNARMGVVVEILLQAEANVNARSARGGTALDHAQAGEAVAVERMLREKGAENGTRRVNVVSGPEDNAFRGYIV